MDILIEIESSVQEQLNLKSHTHTPTKKIEIKCEIFRHKRQ